MPFSFPSSPTNGQQSTQNGRVYSWTGSAWELVAAGSITPSDIGASAVGHTHSASQVTDFASAVAAAAPTYAIQSDTVSNVSYIGRAVSGTATSAEAWRIRRITVAAAGTATVATATNVAWNNRLTASYS